MSLRRSIIRYVRDVRNNVGQIKTNFYVVNMPMAASKNQSNDVFNFPHGRRAVTKSIRIMIVLL